MVVNSLRVVKAPRGKRISSGDAGIRIGWLLPLISKTPARPFSSDFHRGLEKFAPGTVGIPNPQAHREDSDSGENDGLPWFVVGEGSAQP